MGLKATNAKLYDSVSRFAHPSMTAIAQQASMKVGKDGEPYKQLSYHAEPWAVDWQAQTACCALAAATGVVAGYYGLDASPIRAWEETAQAYFPSWFPPNLT